MVRIGRQAPDQHPPAGELVHVGRIEQAQELADRADQGHVPADQPVPGGQVDPARQGQVEHVHRQRPVAPRQGDRLDDPRALVERRRLARTVRGGDGEGLVVVERGAEHAADPLGIQHRGVGRRGEGQARAVPMELGPQLAERLLGAAQPVILPGGDPQLVAADDEALRRDVQGGGDGTLGRVQRQGRERPAVERDLQLRAVGQDRQGVAEVQLELGALQQRQGRDDHRDDQLVLAAGQHPVAVDQLDAALDLERTRREGRRGGEQQAGQQPAAKAAGERGTWITGPAHRTCLPAAMRSDEPGRCGRRGRPAG